MKKIISFLLLNAVISSLYVLGQQTEKPESQISFARENKSHPYYVRQAELWWQEIEKDKSVEDSWYHYYRACRNAQGTANWRTDFVEESPYLRLGEDIVKLMAEYIPDTFTYNFVMGSTGGVDTEGGTYLLKAYQMNPDFDGLLSDVVTYAVSTHQAELRKEANERWFANNGLSPALLTYGYNLLHSLAPNSILFTENDNDTYPAWMLQDAKQIRTDVLVINIDFLLFADYREKIFANLGVDSFELIEVDLNEYEINWQNVLTHFLSTYRGPQKLYVSKTISEKRYQGLEDSLYCVGLALQYSRVPLELKETNLALIEQVFLLDQLKIQFTNDPVQDRINEMNLNYLETLYLAFESCQEGRNPAKAEEMKTLALRLLQKQEDHPLSQYYAPLFE